MDSAGMPGTQFNQTQSHPIKCSAIIPGLVKTQILPNIRCQILHLCISYINKTGFSQCAKVKLKYQQLSPMV